MSDFTPKSVSFVGLSWLPFSKKGLVIPQIAPTKNNPRSCLFLLLSRNEKYQLTRSAYVVLRIKWKKFRENVMKF